MNAGDTLLQRYRVLARHALEFSTFASNAADAGLFFLVWFYLQGGLDDVGSTTLIAVRCP